MSCVLVLIIQLPLLQTACTHYHTRGFSSDTIKSLSTSCIPNPSKSIVHSTLFKAQHRVYPLTQSTTGLTTILTALTMVKGCSFCACVGQMSGVAFCVVMLLALLLLLLALVESCHFRTCIAAALNPRHSQVTLRGRQLQRAKQHRRKSSETKKHAMMYIFFSSSMSAASDMGLYAYTQKIL
jgi:hypothetical protein